MKTTLKQRQKMKEYASRPENKIKKKEYMKQYLIDYDKKNKDKISERKRIYYLKNKQEIDERNKKWMQKNKDKFMQYRKIYDTINKNKLLEYGRKWHASLDKKEYRRKKRIWENNARRNNLNYLIKKRLRSRIWQAFNNFLEKGKIMSSKKYGIDYENIIRKLINELPIDFHEKKYEIDHKKPLFSFDLTIPNEIIKAFAPGNHQWLSEKEHLEKSISERRKVRLNDNI